MKFYWRGLTKDAFTDYCARMKNNVSSDGYYLGCVRVGNLCFDLIARYYGNTKNPYMLDYDLYIGDIDDGYAFSNGHPYTYDGGGTFEDTLINLTYKEFKKFVQGVLTDFIMNEGSEHGVSLVKKANEPLQIW